MKRKNPILIKRDYKGVEQELIYKIIEQWGNIKTPIEKMVEWLQEYANISQQDLKNKDTLIYLQNECIDELKYELSEAKLALDHSTLQEPKNMEIQIHILGKDNSGSNFEEIFTEIDEALDYLTNLS